MSRASRQISPHKNISAQQICSNQNSTMVQLGSFSTSFCFLPFMTLLAVVPISGAVDVLYRPQEEQLQFESCLKQGVQKIVVCTMDHYQECRETCSAVQSSAETFDTDETQRNTSESSLHQSLLAVPLHSRSGSLSRCCQPCADHHRALVEDYIMNPLSEECMGQDKTLSDQEEETYMTANCLSQAPLLAHYYQNEEADFATQSVLFLECIQNQMNQLLSSLGQQEEQEENASKKNPEKTQRTASSRFYESWSLLVQWVYQLVALTPLLFLVVAILEIAGTTAPTTVTRTGHKDVPNYYSTFSPSIGRSFYVLH